MVSILLKSSGFLSQSTCYYLLFGVLIYKFCAFCPEFQVAFNGRNKVTCAYSIFTRTSILRRQFFQCVVLHSNSMTLDHPQKVPLETLDRINQDTISPDHAKYPLYSRTQNGTELCFTLRTDTKEFQHLSLSEK